MWEYIYYFRYDIFSIYIDDWITFFLLCTLCFPNHNNNNLCYFVYFSVNLYCFVVVAFSVWSRSSFIWSHQQQSSTVHVQAYAVVDQNLFILIEKLRLFYFFFSFYLNCLNLYDLMMMMMMMIFCFLFVS